MRRGAMGRQRPPRTLVAATTTSPTLFLLLLLVALLTLTPVARGQGVLRGAAAAASGSASAEIGADGGFPDPVADESADPRSRDLTQEDRRRSLLPSSFPAAAAGAGAWTARLLPLGTHLLYYDVEGRVPGFSRRELLEAQAAETEAVAALLLDESHPHTYTQGRAGGSNKQQQSAAEAREQARPPRYTLLQTLSRLLRGEHRDVAESSPSRHPILPLCGLVAPIVDTPGFCFATAVVEARTTRGPRAYARASVPTDTIYENEKEPAQDKDGSLPQPLADLGTPAPLQVDAATIEKERHTYYFYLRLIWNVYRYTKRWIFTTPGGRAGDGSLAPPFVPSGWTDAKVYHWNIDDPRGHPPAAQSFVKGEHMVLVLRGTVFNGGAIRDLEYDFADPEDTAPWGIPGQVHQGFLDLASQLFDPVREEIERHPQLTRVTLAGHSLGGAIIPLIAAHLKSRLLPTRPNLTLEYVSFAGPSPGDQDFVNALDANPRLRQRRVMYLGGGIKHPKGPYGIGDGVPQTMPPCWALPGCADTYAYKTGETFQYAMAGGIVAFYAEDMPGTAQWRVKEQVFNISASPAACHNCAYMCWAVQGLDDPEDRCHFENDPRRPPFPCVYSDFLDRGDDVDPDFGY